MKKPIDQSAFDFAMREINALGYRIKEAELQAALLRIKQQQQRAAQGTPNEAGQSIEDLLADHMTRWGVAFKKQVFVGRSVFHHRLRVDFKLLNLALYPNGLIVESRWQGSQGSIDDKFIALAVNILKCYPLPTVVVVGGKGAKVGAVNYLRERVDGQRLVAVYDMEDFLLWVMRAEKRHLAL